MTFPHPTVLLVPTYGWSRSVQGNLAYLSKLGGDGLEVVIADNSENSEKHRFLRGLQEGGDGVRVCLHERNIGAFNNFLFLHDQSSGAASVCYCADDDHVSLDYILAGARQLEENPMLARSAGRIILLHGDGRVSLDGETSVAPLVSDRFKEFFNPGSFNAVMYSVSRRETLQPWVDFCRDHPLQAAFLDRFAPLSSLAFGGLVRHQQGHYLWSAANWDSPEAHSRSHAGFYERSGADPRLALFADLHFGVECVHFCLGAHSPIPHRRDRMECARILWRRCLDQFRRTVAANQQVFVQSLSPSPAALEALRFLLEPSREPGADVVVRFAEILAVFHAELAEHYKEYVLKSLRNGEMSVMA